jgi:ABC-type glycerol-3-phosphate transport system substrate-binding protein
MPKPVFYYRIDQNQNDTDPSYELQAQGKLGMWFDSSLGGFDPANSQADPTVARNPTAAIAPLPIGLGGVRSADFNISGLYISANSQNPQACLSLFKYLSNQSGTFNYGSLPARTSQARSATFETTNSYLAPLRDAMIPMLDGPATNNGAANAFYSFEGYWLNQALDEILNKKADPTAALTKAESTTNTFLECVAKLEPNASQLACAKEADPDYKGYLTDQNPVPLGVSRQVP